MPRFAGHQSFVTLMRHKTQKTLKGFLSFMSQNSDDQRSVAFLALNLIKTQHAEPVLFFYKRLAHILQIWLP